jgi:hypothetical protein
MAEIAEKWRKLMKNGGKMTKNDRKWGKND